MSSIFYNPATERKLKVEKEQIITKFRQEHLSKGTSNGTVTAFVNMFSNDPVSCVQTADEERRRQRDLRRRQRLRRRSQRRRSAHRQGYAPPHAAGILHFANKDVYCGSWLQNLFHGQGAYFFANGERYEGGYENGKKQGVGKYFYANGDVYEGGWIADLKKGQGKTTFASGDV